MKKFALLITLLVGGWIFSSSADARTLDYTLPSFNAAKMFDPETGDSVSSCELNLSHPLTDLHYTRIYHERYVGNGVWVQTVRNKFVAGRAGQADTLIVPDNVSVFIKFIDYSGNASCQSNTIGPVVTGVPDQFLHVVRTEIYDLHGRRVSSLEGKSSGIYFRKYYWNDGVSYTKKFVHLK